MLTKPKLLGSLISNASNASNIREATLQLTHHLSVTTIINGVSVAVSFIRDNGRYTAVVTNAMANWQFYVLQNHNEKPLGTVRYRHNLAGFFSIFDQTFAQFSIIEYTAFILGIF